ncbi:hypothetical protein CARUB_v10019460mg [Capsella rubella]|uniref:TIR domain-containing protein n=1 Tax=Capsella rubella TaxID=81985 RepID=R0FU66_9BRAS|nr:hypothetical protein CARUB_v10019460mg [Capsella rubella]
MNSSFIICSVVAAVGFFKVYKRYRFHQDKKDTTKSSSLSSPSPPSSLSLPSPSTSLSLSSPSTSVSQVWEHHVFPSFHGADVRKTILSHILESFRNKGIDSFIDNDIERSKSIGPKLVEAIKGSKIAIVLLSKNYASSSWCLDELAEIMKCREVLGKIVMTIFYEVDPTDIKKQIGDFGKAFRKTCKGKTKERTEIWRKALEDVAQIAGYHSRNWLCSTGKVQAGVENDATKDNRSFIGINLDLSETKEELNISEKALARMSDLEIIRINGDKDFDPSQLERLHSLLYHSQKIRLLDWSYFQNTCLPSTFNLKFLVELDMCFSKLQKLWEGTKQLKNLRRMNLYLSKDLKELPDLSTATNLEDLFLKGCSSLVELPSSIGNATNLRELDLLGCSSLVELPSSIGNATNLHYLVLSQCSSLVELPSSIGNATNLQYLVLSQCSSLVELPSSIGNATSLRELNLSKCSKLVKIPSSIENLTNLEKLNLSDCFNLTELPLSIGTATNLRELNISGCSSLVNLPSSIGDLTNLKEFDLSNCSRLKSFPEISTNIEVLKLTGTAIKEVPMSIMSCSGLSDFRISYFESLKDFPHALDIITYLQLNEDIQEVSPWVKEMSCLRTLRLDNCKNLVSLPQFSDSLCEIDADNCQSLERLDCSFEDDYIGLEFRNCFKLNQEARDLIMHTWTATYAILPGTQVPVCFNHRATAEGSLTIKLNESCLPESLSFKACIMLVNINEETVDEHVSMRVNIKIMDKQNDLEVYINRALTEHIYTFDVEAEDVTSTELVFEFTTTNNSKWKIGECGFIKLCITYAKLVYDCQCVISRLCLNEDGEEEEKVKKESKS